MSTTLYAHPFFYRPVVTVLTGTGESYTHKCTTHNRKVKLARERKTFLFSRKAFFERYYAFFREKPWERILNFRISNNEYTSVSIALDFGLIINNGITFDLYSRCNRFSSNESRLSY